MADNVLLTLVSFLQKSFGRLGRKIGSESTSATGVENFSPTHPQLLQNERTHARSPPHRQIELAGPVRHPPLKSREIRSFVGFAVASRVDTGERQSGQLADQNHLRRPVASSATWDALRQALAANVSPVSPISRSAGLIVTPIQIS